MWRFLPPVHLPFPHLFFFVLLINDRRKGWMVKTNVFSHSWPLFSKEHFHVGSCFLYKSWLVGHWVFSACFKCFLCQWNLIVIKPMWCVYIVHSLHICFACSFAWVTKMSCINRIIYRCVFSFEFQLKVLLCFSATAELGSKMVSFNFLR